MPERKSTKPMTRILGNRIGLGLPHFRKASSLVMGSESIPIPLETGYIWPPINVNKRTGTHEIRGRDMNSGEFSPFRRFPPKMKKGDGPFLGNQPFETPRTARIVAIRKSKRSENQLRRPPPKPPPRGRSVRAWASLTVRLRPLRSLPLRPAMALSASSLFGISTKPKPRDSPLNLSLMMDAVSTAPKAAKVVLEIGLGHAERQVADVDVHTRLL